MAETRNPARGTPGAGGALRLEPDRRSRTRRKQDLKTTLPHVILRNDRTIRYSIRDEWLDGVRHPHRVARYGQSRPADWPSP